MSLRAAGRLLAVGALALLLAGCFKVNMDMEVSPDNTVSGSAIMAVDESLLQLSGQNVDELFSQADLSGLPQNTSVKDYADGGFVGKEITFDSVPLDEFSGSDTLSAGTGEELSIVRQGDEFHVSGKLDMSGEEFAGVGEIPAQLLENFEFRISITFPGRVQSATGEIDGNTVTWEPKFGQENPIQAVASAIPSSDSPLMLILLIVAVVLVLAAVAFLVMRGRKPAPAAGPIEDAAAAGPIEESAMVEPPASAVPATEPAPPVTPVPPAEPAPHTPEAPGSAVPHEDEGSPPPVPPVSD
jgi:phosphatidylinositol mannoside-binding LppM-like protein